MYKNMRNWAKQVVAKAMKDGAGAERVSKQGV